MCKQTTTRMTAADRRTGTIPYALLGVAQIAVGAAAIFARFALTGAQPLAVCAARLTLAALVVLGARAVFRRTDRTALPKFNATFALAGVALAAHFATWIWSLEYLSVGVSTLLVATTPLWTALYDALVHGKRPSVRTIAGFAAGAAGIALVLARASGRPPLPGHELLGSALAISGALAIGAYFIAVRDVRGSFDTQSIVMRTYAIAAVVLIAAAAMARQPAPAFSDGVAWSGIAGMALVSQLVGHTALNAALRWFSPSAVAFTTLLEPVCAGALGWVFLGEQLAFSTLAGGAIVLGAVAVVLWDEACSQSRNWSAPVAKADRSIPGGSATQEGTVDA